MFRRTALLAATAAVALAMTACGSEDAPAADRAPTTSVTAQMPASPQVTVAAPSDAGDDGSSESAEVPAPAGATPADPAHNTEPITPVDPATYSVSSDQIAWKSPSGNVYCKIGSGLFSSGCQASDAPVPAGAEADCAPNTTFSVDMLSKGFYLDPGKVTPTCFNQGVFGFEGQKVLGYNNSVTFNGFTCLSRIEAMICDAGGGHGFVLSMQQATSN